MSSQVSQLTNFSAHVDGAVAILTYDLPKTGNSLKPSVFKSQLKALQWAVDNPDIRVIVQTGRGRFFTTGRDMSPEDGEDGDTDPEDILNTFRQVNETLIKCPKILIAAVNGPAAGYGVTTLALYDLVYSVPDAYFFTPFSKWALAPEGCSSVTFPAIMGHQKAAALLLGGERMTAEELYVAGLVTKVVPANSNQQFMDSVLATAQRIAAYPPKALVANKSLVTTTRQAELLEANIRECEALKDRVLEPECHEALLLFAQEKLEKKAKKSQGDASKL